MNQTYERHARNGGLQAETYRAYEVCWEEFVHWCNAHEVSSLPASEATLLRYLSQMCASLGPMSIYRRLASIALHHRQVNLSPSTRCAAVRILISGHRRKVQRGLFRKRHLTVELLRVLTSMPEAGSRKDELKRARDRCLLLLGFAGGFKGVHLRSIDVENVHFVEKGLIIENERLPSHRAPIGRGTGDTCPVQATRRWIELARLSRGPLFRPINRHGTMSAVRISVDSLTMIIQGHAKAAGLDPSEIGIYSLRAGFLRSAGDRSLRVYDVLRATGMKDYAKVERAMRREWLRPQSPL